MYDGDCSQHAYYAPDHGVQVLKVECLKDIDPKLYIISTAMNFLCWENGLSKDEYSERWSPKNDDDGKNDYYHYHRGPQKIIYGREINREIYERVMQKVKLDGNFDEMKNFQPGKDHRG